MALGTVVAVTTAVANVLTATKTAMDLADRGKSKLDPELKGYLDTICTSLDGIQQTFKDKMLSDEFGPSEDKISHQYRLLQSMTKAIGGHYAEKEMEAFLKYVARDEDEPIDTLYCGIMGNQRYFKASITQYVHEKSPDPFVWEVANSYLIWLLGKGVLTYLTYVCLSDSRDPKATTDDWSKKLAEANTVLNKKFGIIIRNSAELNSAATAQAPIRLYNPQYQMHVFISHDDYNGDKVVAANRDAFGEPRGEYKLVNAGVKNTFKLFNPVTGMQMFVSNDKLGGDHVVEAHGALNEARNNFTFQESGDGNFLLFNQSYNEYMFVSNDNRGHGNVVENHSRRNEPREKFTVFRLPL